MNGEALTAEMQKIAERVAQALDEIPQAFDAKRKRRERLEQKIAVALESTYRFAEIQGAELGIMIGARDSSVRVRTSAGEMMEAATRTSWGARLMARLGLVRLGAVREAVRAIAVPPTLPNLAVEMARRLRDDVRKRTVK